MALNDPVLQRAMFQKQGQAMAPAVGLGGGLGSMTTPDENAKALRSMFAPTVDLNMPSLMLGQEQLAVQSFRAGGQVVDGVKHFQQGGLNTIPRFVPGQDMPSMAAPSEMGIAGIPLETPLPVTGEAPAPTPPRYVPRTPIMRSLYGMVEATPSRQAVVEKAQAERAQREEVERAREANPVPTIFAEVTDEERAAAKARPDAAVAAITSAPSAAPSEAPPMPPRRPEITARPDERTAPPAAAPAAAPAREKGALELTLDGIREERARSAEDKRQNALLALMQAGFAMAAGRSPNALSNIGAGGQAGIAAFASLEKARREEQAALRRDETAIRLAQAKMAEDPEAVKTFRILGGGDIMKGFEIFNADKKLQAAIAVTKDITAAEEDRKAANEYIRGQLTKARTGGGSFAGFSATPVR